MSPNNFQASVVAVINLELEKARHRSVRIHSKKDDCGDYQRPMQSTCPALHAWHTIADVWPATRVGAGHDSQQSYESGHEQAIPDEGQNDVVERQGHAQTCLPFEDEEHHAHGGSTHSSGAGWHLENQQLQLL